MLAWIAVAEMLGKVVTHPRSTIFGQGGFLLLEAIIAFAIGALALGVLFQAALTALNSTNIASHYEQAVSRARSRLVIAEHGNPLAPGDWQGDDGGGFSWHLHIAPIATTAIRSSGIVSNLGTPSRPITLYSVTVWVSWRDWGIRRSIRLDTEQIGPAAGR